MGEYPRTLFHPENGPQEVWNASQQARAEGLGWVWTEPGPMLAMMSEPVQKHHGWPKGKPRKVRA